MTSIKPPVLPAPTATDVHAPVGSAAPGARVEASFPEALGRAGHVGQAGIPQAAAPNAASVDALARELQAGRLSPEQAIERLVERAAASVDPSLSAEERADLLDVLRAALASDPTLAVLRDAL